MSEPSRGGRRPVEAPREIALIRLSALGDVVRALPVANALKRAYPDARLTWVIEPLAHRLIHDHPAVDSFIVVPRRPGVQHLRSYARLYRELRGRRFDLVLVLQTAFKGGLATALIDSPVKLGFDLRRAKELSWLFTTDRIPPRSGRHVLDEYFEFLEFLGVDPEPVTWDLGLTEAELAEQRRFFERLGRPACAVVVGTSHPAKNWPPTRYARLLEALESEYGFRCVLVGGPSRSERTAADLMLAQAAAADAVDALGDDVRRLAWLIGGSDLVVSPDTGPLHIARALDVPVVGLFGFSNPKRVGPYGKYADLVVDGYARWSGEDYACVREHRRGGMARISVDAVLEKVRLAMERYLAPSRP